MKRKICGKCGKKRKIDFFEKIAGTNKTAYSCGFCNDNIVIDKSIKKQKNKKRKARIKGERIKEKIQKEPICFKTKYSKGKKCIVCKEVKDLDQFHKRTKDSEGRRSECKSCVSIIGKERRMKILKNNILTPEESLSRHEQMLQRKAEAEARAEARKSEHVPSIFK